MNLVSCTSIVVQSLDAATDCAHSCFNDDGCLMSNATPQAELRLPVDRLVAFHHKD